MRAPTPGHGGDMDDTVPVAEGQTAPAPQASIPPVGSLAGGRYELLQELGRGGHGAVFKAHDRHADADVALKILSSGFSSEEDLALLRRELTAARRVTHPGVVRLHDLTFIDHSWALSMELVEGRSLEALIDAGTQFSSERVVEIARALAEALAAAHEAGVTHRDLKPANVLVTDKGEPKITDFGISRLMAGEGPRDARAARAGDIKLTQEGVILGTPLYMAPEQLAGQAAVGPSADVYAFGLIVFELATGRLPHSAGTVDELRRLRREVPPPPLATLRADLPEWLTSTVDACLAAAPSERPANGAELVARLTPARKTRPPVSKATPPPKRSGLFAIVLALAVALVVTAPAAVWLMVKWRAAGPKVTSASAGPESASLAPSVAPAAPGLGLTLTNHRRVSAGDVCAEFPSFTRDGRALVYDVTRGARADLVLRSLEDGSSRDITKSPGWDFAATLSPDGNALAFLRTGKDEYGTLLTDLDGAAPRALVPGELRPSFDPSGQHVWAGRATAPQKVRAADGVIVETLSPPVAWGAWSVLELSDGRVAAIIPNYADNADGGLAIASAGPERRWTWLYRGHLHDYIALSPDGAHLLVTRITPTTHELTAIPLSGGPPLSLASWAAPATKGLAFSPDRKQVAWSNCRAHMRPARLEAGVAKPLFPSTEIEDRDAVALGLGAYVLVTDRGGAYAVWRVDRDGSGAREIAAPALPSELAISHSGKQVAVLGADGVTLVDPEGRVAPRLLRQSEPGLKLSYRYGDKELLYTWGASPHVEVRALDLDSGAERTLLRRGDHSAAGSPRADEIVFLRDAGDKSTLGVWSAKTGETRTLLEPAIYLRPEFSSDGRHITVIRDGVDVLVIDAQSGRLIRVEKGVGSQLRRAALLSDGSVLVGLVEWTGSVWVADVDG